MRRHTLLLAVPICAAALGIAPAAARADVVPAPPGAASAVAAQVGSLLDISQTDATAGSGASSADASVIRLGGEPLLNLGGSQTGDGDTGGSLLDTGASLPARVQVAPWHASADGSQGPTRHARGSAAVARADLPSVVTAGVLTSDSNASYTEQKSSGTATSDGVQLGILGAIRVVLLHSEVSSESGGHSYLVGFNDTQIGTDDQLGTSPLCALNAGLASLSCLTGSGGTGASGTANAVAQVAQVTPALDALGALNPVAAFTTSATSGTGQAPAVTAPAPAAVPQVEGETSRAVNPETGTAVAPSNSAAGALPRTGTAAASLAAGALAMTLLGLGLRRFRIRTAS
jgi:LPXTG cell wall anchor motif